MIATTAVRNLPSRDLNALVSRARVGDDAALGALYEIYSPGVYRYLLRRLNDPESARDVTASVFERVLEAVRRQNIWRDSFSGWLYRIAHNQMVDHIRTQQRQTEVELGPNIACPRAAAMEDEVARALTASDVRAALEHVRPAYAAILRLRFDEGLTHAEAGKRLGKTGTNVKVTQGRALKAVRRQMVSSGHYASRTHPGYMTR